MHHPVAPRILSRIRMRRSRSLKLNCVEFACGEYSGRGEQAGKQPLSAPSIGLDCALQRCPANRRTAHSFSLAEASEQWQPNPNGGGACLEVTDLDAALAHVKSHQVRVVMEIQDYSICRMALISDPDGNNIELIEWKETYQIVPIE